VIDKASLLFLDGYELGSQGECSFTKVLSKTLEEKCGIRTYAAGWPGQIERYAKKLDIDWMQGFHLVASEVLNECISQGSGQKT